MRSRIFQTCLSHCLRMRIFSIVSVLAVMSGHAALLHGAEDNIEKRRFVFRFTVNEQNYFLDGNYLCQKKSRADFKSDQAFKEYLENFKTPFKPTTHFSKVFDDNSAIFITLPEGRCHKSITLKAADYFEIGIRRRPKILWVDNINDPKYLEFNRGRSTKNNQWSKVEPGEILLTIYSDPNAGSLADERLNQEIFDLYNARRADFRPERRLHSNCIVAYSMKNLERYPAVRKLLMGIKESGVLLPSENPAYETFYDIEKRKTTEGWYVEYDVGGVAMFFGGSPHRTNCLSLSDGVWTDEGSTGLVKYYDIGLPASDRSNLSSKTSEDTADASFVSKFLKLSIDGRYVDVKEYLNLLKEPTPGIWYYSVEKETLFNILPAMLRAPDSRIY